MKSTSTCCYVMIVLHFLMAVIIPVASSFVVQNQRLLLVPKRGSPASLSFTALCVQLNGDEPHDKIRDIAANHLTTLPTDKSPATLTASNGEAVSTLTASKTVGANGPMVLSDFTYLDHMAEFDHERIPERVVHAKGAGAFGYFEVTDDSEIRKVCKSEMFKGVGKRTPMAARFSAVRGESGSADTARDPRGFALKFYTTEGNWDLVANNTPIFFIRDPILFPSFIHTQKRNAATHLPDANMFWDFMGLRPETVHQMSFLFGDRGTPNGFRHMNGYGSNTFKNINEEGEPFYVKYHFKTDQGIANLPAEKAVELMGSDPDYATRDLFNAIANGNFPSWTMYIQVMTYEEAEKAPFDPFDVTKIWPHKEYPLREVGRMVLDRNPQNHFAEVEQMAFSPTHMIPGIEPSPDKMLQGRLFSYPDAHRHRLGKNYQQIPVNMPVNAKVATYNRDGPMVVTDNGGGGPNYFPNSFSGPIPRPLDSASIHVDSASGDVKRFETGDEDNFSQCGVFYREVLDDGGRDRLTTNIAGHMAGACARVRERAIQNFESVDPDYGQMVRDKIEKILEKKGDVKDEIEGAELSPPRTVPNVSSQSTCPYTFLTSLINSG